MTRSGIIGGHVIPDIGAADEQPSSALPQVRSRSRLRALAEVGVMLVIVGAVVGSVFATESVSGAAMSPTLGEGERVLTARLPYALEPPKRGDLAVVREPGAQGSAVVRRVVGLPGDKVTVRGKQVLVNDRVLDEAYLSAEAGAQSLNFAAEYRLGDGEFLLLSDSRETQAGFNDSRSWGSVPANRISGRAVAVFWPLEQARLLPSADFDGGN